ncbi:MAG: AraC family transcriptional regulator [Blautia sp.]|nr:AraC family transcriptional regulator [Blautia sp.]MCM1200147.1 AraC family transcriptional regulator [Bacteroides fragilis]
MSRSSVPPIQNQFYDILPGIMAVFKEYTAEKAFCGREAEKSLLEIDYCRSGRIGWNMRNGRSIYLGPGDFFLHTGNLCAGCEMSIPNGYYEGLTVCIDLEAFDRSLPALLSGTGITGRALADKFCSGGGSGDGSRQEENFAVFYGNERTESIFSGFYHKEGNLFRPCLELKTLELLLYLGEAKSGRGKETGRYRAEQVETVREVHDYLLQHMDKRVTIEELSQKYLMNPTTLKAVFKEVYGESLASHMKEHRMEKAAELLGKTGESIAQIAKAVGYGSQSRFSTAFKDVYRMLPLEYRKLHAGREKDKQENV